MTSPRIVPTVVGVWAHPDDESYLAGGLYSMVTSRGGRVVNVTATRGERGAPDPSMSPESVAGLRTCELRRALAAVGVREQRWFDLADGAVADAPAAGLIDAVAAVIADVGPDIVVTFGPDGVTGHPDHVAIGRAASLAFARAAPRGASLSHSGSLSSMPDDIVDLLFEAGAFMAGYPDRRVVDRSARIDLVLSTPHLQRKLAAVAAHESQVGPMAELLGESGMARMCAIESFVPVAVEGLAEERAA